MLEARDELGLKRRWGEPKECTGCKRGLAKGPRWWVCNVCSAECPSHLHPGWGEM